MDAYVTNWNGSNPWEQTNSSLAWTEEDEIAAKNPNRNSSSGGNEIENEMTPVPMPTSLAAVTGMAKAKKQITNKVKRRAGQPKMDTNKAMSVMNFSSTREFMDRSSGLDPKKELDKKHFDNMMKIVKRKKDESKADDGKKEDYAKQFRKKKLTAEDEVRILHEAYQFLLRKFNLGSVGGEDEVKTDRYGAPILEYPTLAAMQKDPGQDKMEQEDPDVDNDNVFEEATKSEDEDFEREMQLAPKPTNLRRVKSFRNFKKK